MVLSYGYYYYIITVPTNFRHSQYRSRHFQSLLSCHTIFCGKSAESKQIVRSDHTSSVSVLKVYRPWVQTFFLKITRRRHFLSIGPHPLVGFPLHSTNSTSQAKCRIKKDITECSLQNCFTSLCYSLISQENRSLHCKYDTLKIQ